ncbi:MAG: DUF1080 domain-containing protein [Balneolaceae bacterium]
MKKNLMSTIEKWPSNSHIFATKWILLIALTGGLLASCSSGEQSDQNDATTTAQSSLELFNGEDLAGWYTYMRRPEPTSEVAGLERNENGEYTEPIGLNSDPLNVFTVVEEDGEPAIRISGEVFGILVTEQEFENYHLKLEFKWGDEKYPPRENLKMDSGILYHSIGEEGAWGDVWMKSLECQVQETDCGDYISVDTVMVDIPAYLNDEDNRYYFHPDSSLVTFSPERSYCEFNEDHENPMGEWNTMEVYTVDGNSVHVVNGMPNMKVMNSRYLVDGEEVPLVKGKIQLQSEGAEIFYRHIELTSIDEIPAEIWN